MNRDTILPKLRSMIADSLAIDESSVVPDARLIDDLGADSLDFVDLVFAIEKEFGVKVREADFNFLARLDFSSPEVMRDGFITRNTIDALIPLLPALAAAEDRHHVTPRELFSYITVESLCLMIERHGERGRELRLRCGR
jgi:acyl carrier protein